MSSACCLYNSVMNSSTCRILKASRSVCASENCQSCVQACFPEAALLKDTCLPEIPRRLDLMSTLEGGNLLFAAVAYFA
jgi:hypothetical protein